MKKQPPQDTPEAGHELEIIKAVAQAWQSPSTSAAVTSSEFDARRLNFTTAPTRFRLEAARGSGRTGGWDFAESLWDSYEIVTVSKKLEAGLVLDHDFQERSGGVGGKARTWKESNNSLRNLFIRASSRRFSEEFAPPDEN